MTYRRGWRPRQPVESDAFCGQSRTPVPTKVNLICLSPIMIFKIGVKNEISFRYRFRRRRFQGYPY